MTAQRLPRLVQEPDGRVRIEPAEAWWCCQCGHLALLDKAGICANCRTHRPRRCVECFRERELTGDGVCVPCRDTGANEARAIAAVVMSALESPAPRRNLPGTRPVRAS